MEKIRVLHVIRSMERGGAETLIMNIYRNIDKSKVQFDFLLFHAKVGDYEDEINMLGGQIYRLPYLTDIGPFGYKKKLYNFFVKHSYNIVHSHLNDISNIVLKQAKKANIPIRIAHSHTSNVKYPFLVGLIRRYLKSGILKVTTNQFACSKEAAMWLFGSSISDCKLIPNGVMLEKYAKIGSIKGRNKSDKITIGHIGSYRAVKNHRFLVEVFYEFNKVYPSSILLLIGEGELRSTIENLAHELGIATNVQFLGTRSDIPELLSEMDLFIMPSLYEGLPLTLIEAQAAGVNCLITDTITQEVDMGCGLVHRENLNSTSKIWAEKAYEICKNNKEVDSHLFIKKAGFDIKDTSSWLEDFYIKSAEMSFD